MIRNILVVKLCMHIKNKTIIDAITPSFCTNNRSMQHAWIHLCLMFVFLMLNGKSAPHQLGHKSQKQFRQNVENIRNDEYDNVN